MFLFALTTPPATQCNSMLFFKKEEESFLSKHQAFVPKLAFGNVSFKSPVLHITLKNLKSP